MPTGGSRRRRSRRRARRRWLLIGLAAALVAGATASGLWFALSGSGRHEAPVAKRPRLPAWITPSTLVATVQAPTPGYPDPLSAVPTTAVLPTWAGAPSAMPVIATQPGWVQVGLIARPPGTQSTWIKASSASLTRTPYRVIVDVARTRLLLLRDATPVMCAPAAIGTAQSPTPLGHYFVALLARSPNPTYGAFVILTSAFADTTTDWQQAGQPIITIEGPLTSAAAIGTTGTQATTGSVRLLEPDLERLRDVPLGTPFDVVSALRLPRRASTTTKTRHQHLDKRC